MSDKYLTAICVGLFLCGVATIILGGPWAY